MYKNDLKANLKLFDILLDILAISLSYLVAYSITFNRISGNMTNDYVYLLLSFCTVFVLFMTAFRMYHMSTFYYLDRTLKNTFLSMAGTVATVFLYLFMTYNTQFSRIFFAIFISASFILINTEKIIVLRTKNRLATKISAIYVGEPEMYENVIHYSAMSGFSFDIQGYIDIGAAPIENLKILGKIEDIESVLRRNPCEQVVFALSFDRESFMEPYIQIANEMGFVARVVLDMPYLDASQRFVSSLGIYPMITYHSVVMDKISLALKRCIDIAGALTGILLSLPIMLITAIAIKLDSEGPVIFAQNRVGCNGKKFKIYKFRSMYMDAEKRKQELLSQNEMGDSRLFKIKDDPRVTRVGKLIRKTSIDELPQFFNVLIGNMSLVGTRPPTMDEVDQYDRQHWRRISIKPGITGIWQTSGRNDVTDFEEIVRMDISYIENWSLMLDFRLLFRTVMVLATRKGAS